MRDRMRLFIVVLISFFCGLIIGRIISCVDRDPNQLEKYLHHRTYRYNSDLWKELTIIDRSCHSKYWPEALVTLPYQGGQQL